MSLILVTPRFFSGIGGLKNEILEFFVVGMTATEFTIVDSDDPGMMDVAGFDTSCLAVMADFMKQ